MIKSFKHKGLAELWSSGKSGNVDAKLRSRIILRLDRLDVVDKPEGMNLPGYNFHGLLGFDPTRYTVHVNGPWCITFQFIDGDAYAIDLEQYH